MTYRIPKPARETPSGKTVNNLGIAVPLEVLYQKWGDCDSKSLLFASILANYSGQRVVFLIGNDHLFAGVRGTPRRSTIRT